MDDEIRRRESQWLSELRAEESATEYVVSFNYDFERHHLILSEQTRVRYMEAQQAVRSGFRTSYVPSPYESYRDSIARDPEFWLSGEVVSISHPLVMVKHGKTLYSEQWSFLSGLPEDPDPISMVSALGGLSDGAIESSEATSFRRAADVSHSLWGKFHIDSSFRDRISKDFVMAGFGEIRAQQAGKWDSYRQFQSRMVTDGYIPVWWVTPKDTFLNELALAKGSNDEHAYIAAVALGLSNTAPGLYYAVELPDNGTGWHIVHKPTTLSGGFPDNYCAVQPRNQAGATARLGDGEEGLSEAVMAPLPPKRGDVPTTWPPFIPLGLLRNDTLPKPNAIRIKQRLEIK